jgi:hypothetical protein
MKKNYSMFFKATSFEIFSFEAVHHYSVHRDTAKTFSSGGIFCLTLVADSLNVLAGNGVDFEQPFIPLFVPRMRL